MMMSNKSTKSAGNALVTGAGSGIGLAVARALLREGFRVIGTGRDNDRLENATKQLGKGFCPIVLDVTHAERCQEFLSDLPVELKPVDVLVNNAGHDVGGRRPFSEGDIADWIDIIDTNISGLMRVTHAILPGMLERGKGHIVNIGSVAGVYSYESMTVYNASKFALHGFTEALRQELKYTRLRITEILPGLVKTRFATNRLRGDAEAAEDFYQSFPSWLDAEDVAEAVTYAIGQPEHVNISQLMIEPVAAKR